MKGGKSISIMKQQNCINMYLIMEVEQHGEEKENRKYRSINKNICKEKHKKDVKMR